MPELDVTVNLIVEVGVPASAMLDEPRLLALATAVLEAERQSGPWEVAFVLVDDRRMQEMHRQYMGIDTPTDVMTFPNEPDISVPDADPAGGDIIISVERAREQAAEQGQSVGHELRFLAVHGLLHLCGWDDGIDAARTAMLAHGEDLLAAFEASANQPANAG